MLVIARKQEEGIWIGDIFVKILEVRGQQVRLGIEASKNVPIRREPARANSFLADVDLKLCRKT